MRAQLSFVLSQITRQKDRRTDGQTDRQTEFSSLDRVCIPCSAVKTGKQTQRNCKYPQRCSQRILSRGQGNRSQAEQDQGS